MITVKIMPIVFLFLIFTACGDTTSIVPPVLPHDPVSEGWMALENYQYSLETQDMDLLEETLAAEFVYTLAEVDWDDYDGDGIIDTEFSRQFYLELVSQMFSSYEIIELTLEGTSATPWSGDPTGETMQYLRTCYMKAYNWVGGQQEGWMKHGDASFLCKPDSAGVWRIIERDDLT